MKRKPRGEKLIKRIQELYELASKSPDLISNISFRDIQDAFYSVVPYKQKNLEDITESEFSSYVQKKLMTAKKYHFYFAVYQLFNYPGGKILGHGKTMSFNNLPEQVQQDLIFDWEHYYEINTEWARSKEVLVGRKKASMFLVIEVNAGGHDKAIEKATKLAQESVNILRFVWGADLPMSHCKFLIEGSQTSGGTGDPSISLRGQANYQPHLASRIETFSDILTKARPTDIEKRIRNAINIFGIQTSIENNNVRLILLISCLEGLLLSRSDRDYLGLKVAEKVAFLLATGEQKRKKLFDFVTESYDKRSRFAHQDQRRGEEISVNELSGLENVTMNVIYKLIELMGKNYQQIQKEPSKLTVDGLVESEKFR